VIWSAFILGFLGSMHCAGMCGPIALALRNYGSPSPASFYLNKILYNAGRVITYAVLGLVAGSIGAVISIAGLQQALSIVLGILLLLASFAFIPSLRKISSRWMNPVNEWVKSRLAFFLHQTNSTSFTIVGMLNGLLPCGLVYTALAAAAVSGSYLSGAAFMSLFGLGTFPMMLAISLSGKIVPVTWRSRITRIYPYLTMLVAVLLILRGMNLGIPYISPELSSGSCAMCNK